MCSDQLLFTFLRLIHFCRLNTESFKISLKYRLTKTLCLTLWHVWVWPLKLWKRCRTHPHDLYVPVASSVSDLKMFFFFYILSVEHHGWMNNCCTIIKIVCFGKSDCDWNGREIVLLCSDVSKQTRQGNSKGLLQTLTATVWHVTLLWGKTKGFLSDLDPEKLRH